MTHWLEQFEQSPQTTLFLPRTLRQTPTSPSSSPDVCPLCLQPHVPADQSDAHQPAPDDQEGWQQYWANKGQPWRTEPEISPCRQYALAQRRLIQPDEEQGVYPFRGVSLNRADVEWLLATHEGGRGPIDWHDENQRGREGLDLRGAQLEDANLRRLPLANLRGELDFDELVPLSEEQYEEEQYEEEQYEQARLCLRRANLSEAQLTGATLSYAELTGANLSWAQLTKANLSWAQLTGAFLSGTQLTNADLSWAQLAGADLTGVQLAGANLTGAQLAGADLRRGRLEGVQFRDANLINERNVGPRLVDASWSGTNLSVISWSQMVMLGDEDHARHKHDTDGTTKDRTMRLYVFASLTRTLLTA